MSLIPFGRAGYGRCGFATAAVTVEEPGKSWRGKGWNRVGCEEEDGAVELQTDPSTASQFDAIPDLEEKLAFLATCGLGDNQLEQMRRRLPSAVKNTFLKLSVKKLIEVATFMEEEVGIERKDFGNILFANPFIAGSRVDDCLRPKVEMSSFVFVLFISITEYHFLLLVLSFKYHIVFYFLFPSYFEFPPWRIVRFDALFQWDKGPYFMKSRFQNVHSVPKWKRAITC